MKKILIIVFLIIANISFPQEHHKFVENDWIGIWKGNLNILYPSKIQEVPMQIEISKTDTHGKYKWFSKYGEGSSSISKEYFMIVKDENKGNWVIDEGNSIILDMYFTNN